MRITVEKSISDMYAAASKRTSLDTANLSQEEQDKIEELIKESNFFNISESPSKSNAVDFTTYRITVETDDKQHSVIRTNFSIDENLALLVKKVIKSK
jgi:hypothetical protein